jgi:SAM-dependent methyltransferase
MKLYTELAEWWPLLSPPDEYAEEAGIYVRTLKKVARGKIGSVLELGSGGGNNALFLSHDFDLTLVDISPDMLAESRALNPGCEHVEADMRTLRLEREFDAVFIHDAIIYMTSEEDVRSVLATAAAHCRKGGALLVMPDHTKETFVPTTGCGGADAEDGRGARYLQWSYDPDRDDTTYDTLFNVVLRHADGHIENHAEQHTCGLFDRATWLRLVAEAGFDGRIMPFEHSELEEGVCEMIVGKRMGRA